MSEASPTPWSGRFSEPVSARVQRYTASIGFDYRLAEFDIQGSLAHARMLARQAIIDDADLRAIEQGLTDILNDIRAGRFTWKLELEDVHLNIEKALTERVGDAGKRLHTGRSRNDQVATDIRLYLRHHIDLILQGLHDCQLALLDLAEQHADIPMPGHTHLQVAQPVSFGHHMMAYFEMFVRDAQRMTDCRRRMNRLPLGAAALAGTSYPIDRAQVARELGFDGVCENSLDAVSDRDFAIEFSACASVVMMHFSRLSEELILWMNPRFGFIDLPDRFCTGSSIMPQKKNPDVFELLRAKYFVVTSNESRVRSIAGNLLSGYNRDLQLLKDPVFQSFEVTLESLQVLNEVFGSLKVNAENCKTALTQELYATAEVYKLVSRGVPFREAYGKVAQKYTR